MGYPVVFYTNKSGDDYLEKDLTVIATYDCNLKAPVDVENPTIYVAAGASVEKANYCYIAEFGRYYWAKAIAGTASTITFECQSDPLVSFKDDLKQCPAVVARNPWHFDLYLPDNRLPIETRTASAVKKFPNDHFSGDHNCYILTTLGSGVQLTP